MWQCQWLPGYTSLKAGWLQDAPSIGVVLLNRPDKSNAFDGSLWQEFPAAVAAVGKHPKTRVLIIAANGKNFCGGLDLGYLAATFLQKQDSSSGSSSTSGDHDTSSSCPATRREQFKRDITHMQAAYSVLEEVPVPVLAAVQGACVGAGVDLITAADLRFASADAWFCVKEVDLAITADLGTLQRLPAIVGHGVAMDLALTARRVPAAEAQALRLVGGPLYDTPQQLAAGVVAAAKQLAAKPALAVRGTKRILLHTRDHPVAQGLDYVALWNSSFLPSSDMEQLVAGMGQGGAGASRNSSRAAGARSKL